jgi:tRNA pseudouridine55 synthase
LRPRGTPINGILLLDKPSGITSNSALTEVRRLLGAVKAGHTGTLDPLASGLLPICFGEATKFAALLLDADKTYEVVVALGVATNTGDAQGEVVLRGDPAGVERRLGSVLAALTGAQPQVPPMYSALKHKGRPLYEYARAGQEIQRPARNIIVHELELLDFNGDALRLRARVSKGTYIRALAHDMGQRLGCGAHVRSLRRTAVGSLHVREAKTLEAVRSLPEPERRRAMLPLDLLAGSLPRLELAVPLDRAVRHGRRAPAPEGISPGLVALYDSRGAFMGVGEVGPSGEVSPSRLVSAEPEAGASDAG